MADKSKEAEKAYLTRIIAGAALFKTASPDDIAELARRGRSLAIARGKPVASPKGKDEEIYIVETGAAALLDHSPLVDRNILIALFGPGETFGLLHAAELLGDKPVSHHSEWRALTNLTLVAIPMPDFLRIVRRSPDLSQAMMVWLAASLRHLTFRYTSALLNPLETRLAIFFARLATISTGNQWEPSANIGRIQQTLIADMLGVSREHVNRTLTMWEKSGLIFQSKGGDIVIENRKRLSQLAANTRLQSPAPGENEWLWEIEAHINLGLNSAAYDLAVEGVKRSPRDDRYKYLAVLAMARMGSLTEALSLYEGYKLSTAARDEDIASLGPRLRRDLAFAAPGGPDKKQLTLAAEAYEEVFKTLKTTYPGVNAASTFAMSGDLKRARPIAEKVANLAEATLEHLDEDDPSYWPRATLGECRLVSGDVAGAASEFAAASAAVDAAPGKIATTRKQLLRLKAAMPIDDAWIDRVLPIGGVLYFSGPLSPLGDDAAATIARLKTRFAGFLARRRLVAAVGALAAGADIALAEMLLDAGVALHVHLPLPPAEFLAASVAPAGGDWKQRYIACVERAQSIEWMRRSPRSRAAYRLGSRVAIGRAIRHADELATQAVGFIAVQSGRSPEDSISQENAATWRALGLPIEVAEDDWPAAAAKSEKDRGPECLSALIAVGPAAGEGGKAATAKPLFTSIDGDLLLIAFGSPREAIAAADALAHSAEGAKSRLWLDTGIGDPSTEVGRAQFSKNLLTASCRPETPHGKVHASETFVCAAAATPGPLPRFEYAGYAASEEKLEPCPLFLADM